MEEIAEGWFAKERGYGGTESRKIIRDSRVIFDLVLRCNALVEGKWLKSYNGMKDEQENFCEENNVMEVVSCKLNQLSAAARGHVDRMQ